MSLGSSQGRFKNLVSVLGSAVEFDLHGIQQRLHIQQRVCVSSKSTSETVDSPMLLYLA
jgi:hypothetical protein